MFVRLHLLFIIFLFHSTALALSFSCSPSNYSLIIPGDFNLNLLIPSCQKNDSVVETPTDTYIEIATWTVRQLNALNLSIPYELGLHKFEVCNEYDYYDAIFDIYALQKNANSMVALTFRPVGEKINEFSSMLNVTVDEIEKFWIYLVRASVKFLKNLQWKGTVTVIADDEAPIKEFNKLARRQWICVNEAIVWSEKSKEAVEKTDDFLVIFGRSQTVNEISSLLKENDHKKALIILLDGSNTKDIPEDAYLIQEPHITFSGSHFISSSILPSLPQTPLLFDIADKVLKFVHVLINENCHKSASINECFRDKLENYSQLENKYVSPIKIMETLKLENIKESFQYDILHMKKANGSEENSLQKIYSYSVFEDILIDLKNNPLSVNSTNFNLSSEICSTTFDECLRECVNFRDKLVQKTVLKSHLFGDIMLRSESWLFGFISISVLGVIFALAILIFFIISMFKRIVFEGNPTITLLLLLSVICIFTSVIPFTVTGGKESENTICLLRTFSVSLSYAFAFSLLLSRSIILATISKEIGYMSHASGPVQAFLCLFIFAVQCALSLQYFNKCQTLFTGLLFLYSLSYNIILLVLLLCVSPLIFQSQRNYREGKYFTIAAVSTALAWLCWTLCYVFLDREWRDPMICLGLVSTGSILIGTIFIPRTYLMTVAATRDKITNALPTLNTSSSVMNIYKASTQPIYDCINVAAVNGSNNRNKMESPLDNRYYASGTPEINDYEIDQNQTPTNAEKVTRF